MVSKNDTAIIIFSCYFVEPYYKETMTEMEYSVQEKDNGF